MIGNLTVKLLKLINEPECAIHQLEIFTLTTKTRNMLFIDIVLTATDEKRNLYCTNCFFCLQAIIGLISCTSAF